MPPCHDWSTFAPAARAALNVIRAFQVANSASAVLSSVPGTKVLRESCALRDLVTDTCAHIVPQLAPTACSTFSALPAPASISPAALLGTVMMTAVNQPGFNWQCSPIATELETHMLDTVGTWLGLPPCYQWSNTGGAALQSSETDATIVSLVAARRRCERNVAECAMYTFGSVQPHVDKALRVLGFDHVRQFSNPAELSDLLQRDVASGRTPCCVVVPLTSSSACQLGDVFDAARGAGAWCHVDAGSTGTAAIDATWRERLHIEEWAARADTITLSAGNIIPCGMNTAWLTFQSKEAIASTLNATGVYLANAYSDGGKVHDLKDYHLGLGRVCQCFRFHTALMATGQAGAIAAIRRTSAVCDAIAAAVSATGAAATVKSYGRVEVGGRSRITVSCVAMTQDEATTLARSVAESAPACNWSHVGAVPAGYTWSDADVVEEAETLFADVCRYHERLGARNSDGAPACEFGPLPAVAPGFYTALQSKYEAPIPLSDVTAFFSRVVIPSTTHWSHPDFLAFFPSMTTPACVVGDMLSTGLLQPGAEWAASPGVAAADKLLEDTVLEYWRFPGAFSRSQGGKCLVQPTATEAMILVIVAAAAEAVKQGARRTSLVVYHSSDAHFCVIKGAKVAGVQHIRAIATVEEEGHKPGFLPNTQIDVKALVAAVEADVAQGLTPCFVSSNIGATGTCAVDDTAAVAAVAKKFGMWHNIDAAYGGAAAVARPDGAEFSGWHDARSVLINASKWMGAGMDGNLTLVRQADVIANSVGGPHGDDPFSGGKYHFGCSVLRSLKVYIALRAASQEGLSATLSRHEALAEILANALSRDGHDIIKPRFGLVCFRPRAADNDAVTRLSAKLQDRGLFVVTTLSRGMMLVRVALCHPGLTEADMNRIVAVINSSL